MFASIKYNYLLFSFVICSASNVVAQHSPHATSRQQFDFWIGEWELSWKDPQKGMVKGKNVITKEMNDKVIYEHFSDPINNYFGASWSVYDTLIGKWKQTWVDDQGSYLDFRGEFKDGKMTLQREYTSPGGKLVRQRMTFYNISKHRLDWVWEGSTDNGASWNELWKIEYVRTK